MNVVDEFEREAARVYGIAGVETTVGASPKTLVTALLGEGALRWADGNWLRGAGALVRIGGALRIYLNRRYPITNLRFVAMHELGHALAPGASESEVDALAARLLAPRLAFERALAALASPRRSPARIYDDLGGWFRCTHAFGALRLGEVTGEPLALISPDSVRVRGAWSGPTEPLAVRSLAAVPKPGLARARLRDDPVRVVLRATR